LRHGSKCAAFHLPADDVCLVPVLLDALDVVDLLGMLPLLSA
jgi:hypothetical protein